MYELRDYQKEASDAAVRFFFFTRQRQCHNGTPTGSGKSLVIADIAYRLSEPLVIFQPSAEILEQKLREASKLWCTGLFNILGLVQLQENKPDNICHNRKCKEQQASFCPVPLCHY